MHKLDHKKLQRDSGKESGMYIFCDGMMVFSPISKEHVLRLVAALLVPSVDHINANMEALIDKAVPPPAAPSQGEGTHGADPIKTN
jgi:hypothetical protein